jgi:hypothetical protein
VPVPAGGHNVRNMLTVFCGFASQNGGARACVPVPAGGHNVRNMLTGFSGFASL